MATIYFPSCKFTAGYPATAQRISEYVSQQHGMTITGCCRTNHPSLKEEDMAVYICNTCFAFCDESSKARELVSLWEVIAKDEEFPFPDYQGEEIALQDCWRVYERRSVQEAVRKLLEKMNIRVFELPGNFEKSRFCGASLLQTPPADYEKLAPKRFIQNAPADLFQPHTNEEKIAKMQSHCASIPTEKVICYCRACAEGLKLGGKRPVHMAELLFLTR